MGVKVSSSRSGSVAIAQGGTPLRSLRVGRLLPQNQGITSNEPYSVRSDEFGGEDVLRLAGEDEEPARPRRPDVLGDLGAGRVLPGVAQLVLDRGHVRRRRGRRTGSWYPRQTSLGSRRAPNCARPTRPADHRVLGSRVLRRSGAWERPSTEATFITVLPGLRMSVSARREVHHRRSSPEHLCVLRARCSVVAR